MVSPFCFENIVNNMLTCFGPQSLTDLHNHLKMMPNLNKTEDQLEAFLNSLVESEKLEYVNGEYGKKA